MLNLEVVEVPSPSSLVVLSNCVSFLIQANEVLVVLHSVALTYSEFYDSCGIKARASLGEMKCWHLS